jgi:hypothetical protein
MSTIDPKWIQYDPDKLDTVDTLEGESQLTIKEGIVLTGVSSEKVNGHKITVSATEPEAVITPQDLWIEIPV